MKKQESIKAVSVRIDVTEILTIKDLLTSTTNKAFDKVKESAENNNYVGCMNTHEYAYFLFQSRIERDAFYNEIVDDVKSATIIDDEVLLVIDKKESDA